MWLELAMFLANGLIVLASCYLMYHPRKSKSSDELHCFLPYAPAPLPFEASSYLDRMEKVHLDLLRERHPVDWTITLWLGLDGLRINPDGALEWIRREPSPPPLIFAPPWDRSLIYAPPRLSCLLPDPPTFPDSGVLYADGQPVYE